MIREETLTTFDKWKQPTIEEIKEMIAKTGLSTQEIANFLGVSKGTVFYWRSSGNSNKKSLNKISYSNWSWLCFLAGIYINEPSEDIRDLNNLIIRFTKILQKYNERLTHEVSLARSKSKKVTKNLTKITANFN